MMRWLIVWPLVGIVALSGCKASTKPRVVAEVSAARKPTLRRAPFHGEYRLYAAQAQRRGWIKPSGDSLATHRLRQRDRLGFRRTGGELAAVAGDASIPLAPGAYVWQMRADPGQIDNTKTAALVIGIGAGVGLGIAIWASSWSFGAGTFVGP